jgi:predicted DNA-binding protein
LAQDRKIDRHSKDSVNVSIRVQKEWVERLDRVVKNSGVSRMKYIRDAVTARIEIDEKLEIDIKL